MERVCSGKRFVKMQVLECGMVLGARGLSDDRRRPRRLLLLPRYEPLPVEGSD